MKINTPVTNVETIVPENEFIYSTTDLKGVITEANEAFIALSGFTRDELIGNSHNMVRHPDMPPAAFADLWRDLKAGRPWRGIVKNRRKDGGYYWVVANVSPVRENNAVVGYQSVRSRPTQTEISAAETAYQRVAKGDTSLHVEHGRVFRQRYRLLGGLRSLRTQMILIGLIALVALLDALGAHLGGPALPAFVALPVAVLSLLYTAFYLFFYVPKTTRDLDVTENWLGNVLATGNLKQRQPLDRRDVIGRIARETDIFASSVMATIQGIADVARQVDAATKEVDSGVIVTHTSAVKQSDATSSAAAAIEEVTVSIGEVAAYAKTTLETASNTGNISRQGAQVSQDASQAIQALAESVGKSAGQMELLDQRSEEISRVTVVIKEIADQTNLLALNAAIEAARAGETGRGFAVVADEVRKLAERTAKATEEIGSMICVIREETQTAVDGMRAGAKQVAEGVRLVNGAENSLQEINHEMARTMQMVTDITHASDDQQKAMIELAQNVERVSSMTEQNVAVVNQTKATVMHMNAVVLRMQKAVKQYGI